MTAFRVRLDTTTNWAITSSALVAIFALGNPGVAPAAILLLMLLNFFFLHLEARRYRHYEASRHRVRLLERGFYAEILGQPASAEWVDQLQEALGRPKPPLSHWQSIGWRLRRNYLWIYLVVLVIWLGTLRVGLGHPGGLGELVASAALGSAPGWLVFGLVAAFYAWLVGLTVWTGRGYSPEDEW
jgi:uncharacterized membrane protein